jgi:hypothetical protein
MASDEWRTFLKENFNDDSDVVLSLEELTLEQIHGLLGIIERKLFAHTQDQRAKGKMSHLEMWRIDDTRKILKKARSNVGVIIGHEAWQEGLLLHQFGKEVENAIR